MNSSVYGSSISGSSTVNVNLDPAFTVGPSLDCGDVDVATASQFNFNYPGCAATATAWGFSVQPTSPYVQGNATDAGAASQNQTAFNSNNQAGDLIVVEVFWDDQTKSISSIVDSQGNAYVSAIGPFNFNGVAYRDQLFYAKNIKGGANTVTVTLSGAPNTSFEVYVDEYAGADTVSPLDATSVASASANLADSGAATTRYSNELIVGYGENTNALSPGAGFAARSDFNGNLVEDRSVMTPGSYHATINTSGGSTWSMMMATFKLTRGSTFVLVPPTDTAVHVATGTQITIRIGSNATFQQQGVHWITNPSTGGTYTISLGGTFGGSGNMLVAIASGVLLQGSVPESLSLTVSPSVTLMSAIELVQKASSGGSFPMTIASTGTGNLLVVAAVYGGCSGCFITSVSDNASGGSNAWIRTGAIASDATAGAVDIWYAKNSRPGATQLTVGPGNPNVVFWEFSGIDANSPVEATSVLNNQGPSANPAGPSITTALPEELIVSAVNVQNSITHIHAGNAFTNDSLQGNDGWAHLVATSTGTFNAQWDQSSGTYASNAVSFKPAPGCTADDGATVNQFLTTATTVPFGTISPNAFYQGCQDLTVSTNAGDGYSLTVQESSAFRTADGRFIIPDTACDGGACSVATATAWATPTNNGFGHTCANQSGSDCNPTYGNGKKFKPVPNVAGGTAPGQISFVQQNTSASVGAGCGAGSSCSVAFNSKNTAGNLIIVASDVGSGVHVTSISDSEGNTYATATHAVASPGGNVAQVFYAQNIKGGANTVTITLNTTQYNDLYILEYSGLATGGALDVTSTASGTSNSATSGAATTTAPNELIFGFGGGDSGTYSPGPLFSARSTFDGDIAEDEIVNSSGSYTATASISVSAGWTMSMATFKAASIASQALMSNTGPVASSTGRVKYRLSVGSGQPAGTYTTIITYTVLGTF